MGRQSRGKPPFNQTAVHRFPKTWLSLLLWQDPPYPNEASSSIQASVGLHVSTAQRKTNISSALRGSAVSTPDSDQGFNV